MTTPPPDYLEQDLEIELICVLAPHVRERFCVDVGAERGRWPPRCSHAACAAPFSSPWRGTATSWRAIAARHQSRAYPYAIDETDSVRDFFIASDADSNELDHFHSLDNLEGAPPARVGVFKTDTEGHDLRIARGLGPLRPEVVVCEYFTEGLYAGWEDARPQLAVDLMRSKGYSRYVATKRVGELEYCTASPTGFLPRQWGNLFFLGDALFASAEGVIAAFLANVEARFIGGMEAIAADRVAKRGRDPGPFVAMNSPRYLGVREAELKRLSSAGRTGA